MPAHDSSTLTTKSSAPPADPSKLKAAITLLEPIISRAVQAVPACVALHTHAAWLYLRLGEPAKAVSTLDALCRRHPSPLAYIHLMRVSRKVDGRDAARKVFARARKDPKGADPSVYVAAASMEFCINKDSKVARNIFEFGLKNYSKSAAMAKEFVEWLWGLGDFEYMRVVFEKVMPEVRGPPGIVGALWERWIKVEEVLGDAASVDRVEVLWKESGVGRPQGVVSNVLRRCRFLGFEGMSEEELAVVDSVQAKTANSSPSTSAPGGTVKRDPRTGRRITAQGVGPSGSAGAGSTAATAQQQNKGIAGTGGMSNGGLPAGTVLQIAVDRLRRLASSMPPVAGPPPAVDVLFRLLMDTPESFASTPAGASANGRAAIGQGRDLGPGGIPVIEEVQAIGKKRKVEDASQPTAAALPMTSGPLVTTAPPVDVFRSRQAAKQSRLR